jgi:competence protein ComEC
VGDVLTVDGLKFVVVWPPVSEERSENINNSSLAILLDYKNYEALFLGDLEKEASSLIDKKLLDDYVQGSLEVYKVPHHGSINSFNPDLISYLDPKLCILSVGANKYGHPNNEAIEYMLNKECEVRRTDEEGTIELLIN